ncbi:ATP-binding protein [Streptomyces sp. NPDC051445]|uniref:ATP-binding protein n=1 Tax=Streptomyces sp. NPDC051445 TaxID=3365653 RepID=UPI003791F64E
MNEVNLRGYLSDARTCSFSPSGYQPPKFCSWRRPPPSEYETEAIILRLPCLPESVPASRRHTSQLMSSWQIAQPVTDTVALLVSELVTNSVQHSGVQHSPSHRDAFPRHFDLALYLGTEHVRVEVYDEERHLPVYVEAHEYAETGRGIRIIQSCACRWGARRLCTGGKVIWCDVRLPESSRVEGAAIKP